jgi:hypothetical protein
MVPMAAIIYKAPRGKLIFMLLPVGMPTATG